MGHRQVCGEQPIADGGWHSCSHQRIRRSQSTGKAGRDEDEAADGERVMPNLNCTRGEHDSGGQ